MADGLEGAQQVLNSARSGSNRIIIIITDGLPNARIGQELTVASAIKNSGIYIVTVGEKGFLNYISSCMNEGQTTFVGSIITNTRNVNASE